MSLKKCSITSNIHLNSYIFTFKVNNIALEYLPVIMNTIVNKLQHPAIRRPSAHVSFLPKYRERRPNIARKFPGMSITPTRKELT